MIEKVHAIQDEGLEVWCGMIIGFDHDDDDDLRPSDRVPRGGADRQRAGRDAARHPPDTAL